MLWVLADQGLFSLSSFFITLMLSKFLSVNLFAEYAEIYAAYLLGLMVFNSLLIEPMLIDGGYRSNHFFIAIIMSCILSLVIAILLGREGLYLGIIGYVFSLLLVIFSRRVLILKGKVRLSAVLGFICLVVSLASLYLLSKEKFGLDVVLHVLAVVTIVTVFLPVLEFLELKAPEWASIAESLKKSFDKGRHILVSGFFAWFTANVYYFLLDDEATSELKVITTIVMPITQVVSATGLYLIPKFKSASALYWVMSMAVLSLVYSLFVYLFAVDLSRVLWGDRYQFDNQDFLVVGLYLISFNLITCGQTVVKARNLLSALVHVSIVNFIVTVLLVVYFVNLSVNDVLLFLSVMYILGSGYSLARLKYHAS